MVQDINLRVPHPSILPLCGMLREVADESPSNATQNWLLA